MKIIFEQEYQYVEHESCLEGLTLLTLAHELELSAGKAIDRAFEFQCQQHRRCCFRRQAAALTEQVQVQCLIAELRQDRVVVNFIVTCARLLRLAYCHTEFFKNVAAAFHQLCALLEEQMAPLR